MAFGPKLNLRSITDVILRRNLEQVDTYLKQHSHLEGYKFFEWSFDGAVTDYRVRHGMGITPNDVICLSITGAGSLTVDYDEFTNEELVLSTTGACTMRALVGRQSSE